MARLIVRGTRDNPKVYADYRDPCGTRRTKLLRGIQTKTEGKRRLLEIEARLVAGKPGLPEDEPAVVSASAPTASTCGPLIEQWLATLQNRNADDDRGRVRRHLVPAWGKVPVAKVQELAPVMSWIDLMRAARDLSEQSMRHNLNLLSRFLAWAIERGFATVNPVRMIPQGRRPKGSAGGADDAPWIRDDETVHRLMAALPRPVDLMFYLGNRSGLRPGEVAGLQMEDFSWLAEGIIRVAHSYDGPLKEDKAGAGKVKWVPAPEDIGQVVGPWLAQRKSEGAGPRDLVFPFKPAKPQNRRRTSTWKGFRKEYVEACWEEAARAVGVEMTLYQATRHSFVSRHLANGVPLDEVSAAVGHSSPEVTKRFYAHYVRRGFSAEIRRGLSRSAA